MAINLVSLVMQFLTPDMIGRIASALGLDRNNTQTAIGAVVPALLAGFSKTATQPGAAQKLVDAARQQTGTLGNFANMLGTGSQSSLIEKGSQMLSALLGGQDAATINASHLPSVRLAQRWSARGVDTSAPMCARIGGSEKRRSP